MAEFNEIEGNKPSQKIKEELNKKEELKVKEKELKEKEERLSKIPADIAQTKEYFFDMVGRELIKIKKLKLWKKSLAPIRPNYEIETSDEWKDLRFKELELEEKIADKSLEQLKLQETKAIKALNEQESRIKEDIPRLKKRITELSAHN